MRRCFPLFIFLFLASPAFSQRTRWIDKRKEIIRNDTAFYFFKAQRYGVQDLYNPLYVVVNGGFDVWQLHGTDRNPFEYDWKLNVKNFGKNIIHPVKAIDATGAKRFFTQEIFPLNWTPEGAQWVPNYFLHLVGGGMEYRMLAEYYRYHKVPAPKVFSAFTLFTMHFMNEVMENDGKVGWNTDPVADWYFFDIAGIFLFNSIPVSRFFSEKMHMADWSLMPTVSFRDFTLQNAGQYFIYKWEFTRKKNWAVFNRWGMGTQFGITRKFKNENAFTAAGGVRSYELELVNTDGFIFTSTMTWAAFFAWDKNNTPLATLEVNGSDDYTALLNVYPGVIKIRKFSPGIWAVAGRDGTGAFGICARYSLGMGVGYGWK